MSEEEEKEVEAKEAQKVENTEKEEEEPTVRDFHFWQGFIPFVTDFLGVKAIYLKLYTGSF